MKKEKDDGLNDQRDRETLDRVNLRDEGQEKFPEAKDVERGQGEVSNSQAFSFSRHVSKRIFEILSGRVAVAVIGIAVIAILLSIGGLLWRLFLGLVAAVASYEIKRIMNRDGLEVGKETEAVTTTRFDALEILFFSLFVVAGVAMRSYSLLLLGLLITATFMAYINDFKEWFLVVFSWVVLPVFWASFVSPLKLIAILVTVWLIDISAYYTGKYFGKRRGLFPASPNKTLEGTLAGFVVGSVVWVVVEWWVIKAGFISSLWHAPLIAIAAIAGDLFESSFKRKYGVKDSSRILGEHGGVLDRLDSVLFVLIMAKLLKII